MDPTADDIAGVVDLFGALTRAELQEALAELAFKRGGDHEPERFASDIESALETYHLVAVERNGDAVAEPGADHGSGGTEADGPAALLVVGPVAFPTVPEGGEDLPHIMDVPDREVDREAAAAAAEQSFRDDAAAAAERGDAERIETLLDVSYELEAWGPVDLTTARERLDAASDRTN